jgi:hypothetical protein
VYVYKLTILLASFNSPTDIIFAGALFGFALASFRYLNVPGIFCSAGHAGHAGPGECYYYLRGHWHTGILLHLGTILRKSPQDLAY